jgi:2-polyprenyl-6-hydroxyphenyl methylase/3-demethylubiquinone-9 3-methyltransferase
MTNPTQHGGLAIVWWPPRKGYAILHRANSLRFDYFSRYVSNWEGLKVLDVGCGGGYTCEFLTRREAIVFGTDISKASLEAAREHAARSRLRIDYRLATPESLPFVTGEMDIVTCLEVLEHVPDVRPTLSEIRRVLKPAGRLFFDTVNRTWRSKAAAIWFAEKMFRIIEPGTHDWRLFKKPGEIERELQESGFANIELAGLRLKFTSGEKGGLPLQVNRRGNRSIVYFGSAVRL